MKKNKIVNKINTRTKCHNNLSFGNFVTNKLHKSPKTLKWSLHNSQSRLSKPNHPHTCWESKYSSRFNKISQYL